MINRTREFDSQRSCHDPILPSVGLQGNRYSLFKLCPQTARELSE
jgi:hypothetical protein